MCADKAACADVLMLRVLLLCLQDEYDDDDDEDDTWKDGEGDPCPSCGRLYRSAAPTVAAAHAAAAAAACASC